MNRSMKEMMMMMMMMMMKFALECDLIAKPVYFHPKFKGSKSTWLSHFEIEIYWETKNQIIVQFAMRMPGAFDPFESEMKIYRFAMRLLIR